MANPEIFVQVAQVTKTYPSASRPAVSGLSLELHPGEILALLGPNGAGKTTTVKMVAGLILPSSGTIKVLGHDMLRERVKGVRHIGAVLEGARNLYWRLSARENLLYFGGLRQVPRQGLGRRIDELLTLFDLRERQNEEVRHFSRGMQQKLAVAAALLHEPPVLLLDEPTLGLDVQAARRLEESIAQLAQGQGKAILLTTHTMSLAEKLASRILVIHQGREVAHDSTRALLERYNVQRDTIEIQLAGQLPEPLLTSVRETFPDVRVTMDTDVTILAWPSGAQSKMIDLLQFLDGQGATVLGIGRRQASLEEVFLALTEVAV